MRLVNWRQHRLRPSFVGVFGLNSVVLVQHLENGAHLRVSQRLGDLLILLLVFQNLSLNRLFFYFFMAKHNVLNVLLCLTQHLLLQTYLIQYYLIKTLRKVVIYFLIFQLVYSRHLTCTPNIITINFILVAFLSK